MKAIHLIFAVSVLGLAASRVASGTELAALANITSPTADKQAASLGIGTGTMTLIGSSGVAGVAVSSGDTAYDAGGNRLIFVDAASNRLYSVSTATGAVLSSPVLGGAAVTSILDLEYDAGESVLYVIASVATDRQLGVIDILTGIVTLRGTPIAGGSLSTSNGPFDLDAANNLYYFVGSPAAGDTLYAINTATGLVASSHLLQLTGAFGLAGLELDTDSGVLFGLAQVAGGDKQLATVNSTPGVGFGTVTLLGSPISGGNLGVSGMEASDSVANRYYFIGSLGGVQTLYAIDTTNGGVVSANAITFPSGANDIRGLEFDSASLPGRLLSFSVE